MFKKIVLLMLILNVANAQVKQPTMGERIHRTAQSTSSMVQLVAIHIAKGHSDRQISATRSKLDASIAKLEAYPTWRKCSVAAERLERLKTLVLSDDARASELGKELVSAVLQCSVAHQYD